ncbi:hypothetical protein [Burkholderia sp. L27(2015)]|uniref:hypothetical protein n=1 Tax=Burkholderia sp. L27(2015) TaxID=1641858 RepID=UPI00131D5A70|nr:hypothetical protein [Burkholderia sp. L27(2015)]
MMNPFKHLNAEFIDACGRLVEQLEKYRFGAIMLVCLAALVCSVAIVCVTSL